MIKPNRSSVSAKSFTLIKFAKTANLTVVRYAFDHGFREAFEKSKQIHQGVLSILYEGAGVEVDRGFGGKVDDVVKLQSELKPVMYEKGETSKAKARRIREGWHEKFAPEDQPGIDIGCQYDPLNQTFRRWDILFGDGDAALMEGVPDQVFQTVYASHVLEHLVEPELALKNWYRILRPGGHLILSIPHRDLYEKKTTLPSNWNTDHKWFWLPAREEKPHTLGLRQVIGRARLEGSEVIDLRVIDEGYDYTIPIDVHSVGEFSIEAIIRRQ